MITVFNASATTETSKTMDGSGAIVSRIRFQVVGSTWTGSIKVTAQINGLGGSAFPINLPITNLNDGSTIAAATGATADGLYEVDVAGLEVRFVHTRSAGSVTMYAAPVLG